jgi:hypothetical protein
MPAAIKEPMRDLIAQVAAHLAASGWVAQVSSDANVTTVNLGGYTVVKLWDDHGSRFSAELDGQNPDAAHEAEHLELARTAVHRALKAVTDRLLGVAEVKPGAARSARSLRRTRRRPRRQGPA